MRVVGGELGGRTLVAPKGLATRPTGERAREALFNILGDIEGEAVLDLYAGTGAVGIEALSRGARHATFVESDRRALAAITRNVETLGLTERVTILAQPVEVALKRITAEFDVVYADPPYEDAAAALPRVLALVAPRAVNGVIVLEQRSRDPAPSPFTPRPPPEARRYGEATLYFYWPA